MGATKTSSAVDTAPTHIENVISRIVSHNDRLYSLISRVDNMKAKFHGVAVPSSAKGQDEGQPETLNDKNIFHLDAQAVRIEELGDLISAIEEII